MASLPPPPLSAPAEPSPAAPDLAQLTSSQATLRLCRRRRRFPSPSRPPWLPPRQVPAGCAACCCWRRRWPRPCPRSTWTFAPASTRPTWLRVGGALSVRAGDRRRTDSAPDVSIYQTNGLCHDYCMQRNQAYAITQANSCWCSDLTPATPDQVASGRCNRPCPAYPAEFCGGSGVYGYIALNNVLPSGTRGSAQSTSAASSSSSRVSPAALFCLGASTVLGAPVPCNATCTARIFFYYFFFHPAWCATRGASVGRVAMTFLSCLGLHARPVRVGRQCRHDPILCAGLAATTFPAPAPLHQTSWPSRQGLMRLLQAEIPTATTWVTKTVQDTATQSSSSPSPPPPTLSPSSSPASSSTSGSLVWPARVFVGERGSAVR